MGFSGLLWGLTMPGRTTADELLNEVQTAERLGVKPSTLQVWRCTKRYPLPYIKVGRLVRYRQSDLDAFLAIRTQGGAGQ